MCVCCYVRLFIVRFSFFFFLTYVRSFSSEIKFYLSFFNFISCYVRTFCFTIVGLISFLKLQIIVLFNCWKLFQNQIRNYLTITYNNIIIKFTYNVFYPKEMVREFMLKNEVWLRSLCFKALVRKRYTYIKYISNYLLYSSQS